jgi:hypothetical protein
MARQGSAPAALRSLERQATNRHLPLRLECPRPASSPVRLPLPRDQEQDSVPALLSMRGTVLEMSYSPKEFNHQTTDARCRHKTAGPGPAEEERQRARQRHLGGKSILAKFIASDRNAVEDRMISATSLTAQTHWSSCCSLTTRGAAALSTIKLFAQVWGKMFLSLKEPHDKDLAEQRRMNRLKGLK